MATKPTGNGMAVVLEPKAEPATEQSKYHLPTSTPVAVIGAKCYAIERRTVKGKDLVTVTEVSAIHDPAHPLVTTAWNATFGGLRMNGAPGEIRKFCELVLRHSGA